MPLFRGGRLPRVLRVITTRPTRDVIEMTVVVGLERRTRALAVRLERTDPAGQPGRHDQNARLKEAAGSRPAQLRAPQPGPRWLCTAVEAA